MKTVLKLINHYELAKMLGLKEGSIRSNYIPEKHRIGYYRLQNLLERWKFSGRVNSNSNAFDFDLEVFGEYVCFIVPESEIRDYIQKFPKQERQIDLTEFVPIEWHEFSNDELAELIEDNYLYDLYENFKHYTKI